MAQDDPSRPDPTPVGIKSEVLQSIMIPYCIVKYCVVSRRRVPWKMPCANARVKNAGGVVGMRRGDRCVLGMHGGGPWRSAGVIGEYDDRGYAGVEFMCIIHDGFRNFMVIASWKRRSSCFSKR